MDIRGLKELNMFDSLLQFIGIKPKPRASVVASTKPITSHKVEKKKIPVHKLAKGMTVIELDRPWTEIPVLFQEITIESDKEIALLKEYCQFVYIDYHSYNTIYAEQLRHERHVLHEQPNGARSWSEPLMQRLLQHPRVNTVVAHQCEFGLVTPDINGQPMAAKKPTRFASSSLPMLRRLAKKCTGTHPHQPLMGGRAANAAFYPPGLVLEILRGIRDTADVEWQDPIEPGTGDVNRATLCAGLMHDQPSTLVSALQDSCGKEGSRP